MKALTDTLVFSHLETRGWVTDSVCRIQDCNAELETLEHLSSHMDFEKMSKNAVFSFKKAVTAERAARKRKERIVTSLNGEGAAALANLFDGIREPFLKVTKIAKNGSAPAQRGRPRKRRSSVLITSVAKKRIANGRGSNKKRRARVE